MNKLERRKEKMWIGEEQEGKDGMGKERKGNSVESKCFFT